jgi:regulator of nonsense transcripts 3
MTETEFVSILGSEWELGKGKIDWFSFVEGKISTEYGTEYCRRVLYY